MNDTGQARNVITGQEWHRRRDETRAGAATHRHAWMLQPRRFRIARRHTTRTSSRSARARSSRRRAQTAAAKAAAPACPALRRRTATSRTACTTRKRRQREQRHCHAQPCDAVPSTEAASMGCSRLRALHSCCRCRPCRSRLVTVAACIRDAPLFLEAVCILVSSMLMLRYLWSTWCCQTCTHTHTHTHLGLPAPCARTKWTVVPQSRGLRRRRQFADMVRPCTGSRHAAAPFVCFRGLAGQL